MENVKPVFIGGFRSGTTLLVNLLGMQAQVAPWFETKMLCEALRWLHVLKNPEQERFEHQYINPSEPTGFNAHAVRMRMESDLRSSLERFNGTQHSGKAVHEQYVIGFDCIRYSLKQGLSLLDQWEEEVALCADYDSVANSTNILINQLGKTHCVQYGKPIWINKTPEITRFADELRDSVGECRVIYMVRNGLSVVESAKKLGWGDIGLLSYNWRTLLEKTRQAMTQYPEDYKEVRYEDLVSDPVRVLSDLLTFCGLQNESVEIIRRYKQHFDEKVFDKTKIVRPSSLTAEEHNTFYKAAGSLQSELGYKVD